MKKAIIQLAKITAYVTTAVLVLSVVLSIFANKAKAQSLPAPVMFAEPVEETLVYLDSYNQIDTVSVDNRGLYSVKFTEFGNEVALDFITEKEYRKLCKYLARNRKQARRDFMYVLDNLRGD